ncbi:MAG: hypothetical protein HOV94_31170 [Saccharothrix sp.]|nr:hypothetical protein [Saccharothrix sp.]
MREPLALVLAVVALSAAPAAGVWHWSFDSQVDPGFAEAVARFGLPWRRKVEYRVTWDPTADPCETCSYSRSGLFRAP